MALTKFRRQYAWMQQLTRALAEAGVPVIAGTDASVAMVLPGFSLPQELRLLHEAGLTPYQMLAAATRTASACLGDAEVGSIAAGKRADLVLLDRDSLTDLSAFDAPLGVLARGRWFTRAALLARLGTTR
jgi:imidazolonepropionase-like amidohydrolase